MVLNTLMDLPDHLVEGRAPQQLSMISGVPP